MKRVKQNIALFLVLALFSQLLLKVVYIGYWKINQTEIIQKFCVNKDKPKMNCKGKCHLAKQLQKIEEPEQEKSKLPKEFYAFKSLDFFVLCETKFIYNQNQNTENQKKIVELNAIQIQSGHLVRIYQPPELI
jgi:hypothetical protein